MPAGRSNNYMQKLKKQKQSTLTAAGTRVGTQHRAQREAPLDPEEVKKGKKKMRKYIEKASS
jgi:hypothetical protein